MIIKNLILKNISNYKFKILKINFLLDKLLDLIRKNLKNLEADQKFLNKINKVDKNNLDNFIFLLRALDFRLLDYPQNWKYKNEKGFFGLTERIINLFNIINFNQKQTDYSKINFLTFKKIVSPKENITLAKLRHKIFKDCLSWLQNYDNNFYNYFEENKTAFNFCLNLFNLEKFRDFYKNLYFLKPNQLLYFEYILAKKLTNKFKDELESLTIFADYKIPQILISFGLIELPNRYLIKIKKGKIIRKFSLFENELRLASILLGEEIGLKLKIPSYRIDNILWWLSHKIKLKIPVLKIKTIFY